MSRIRRNRLAAVTLVLAALGAAPLAATVWDDPFLWAVQKVWGTVSAQQQKSAWSEQLKTDTKYCIVIDNYRPQAWHFGCLAAAEDKVQGDSGTLDSKRVKLQKTAKVEYDSAQSVGPGDRVDIPALSTVVITPVCASKWLGVGGKVSFARTCYLEDGKGDRVLLTVTKDTSSTAVPAVQASIDLEAKDAPLARALEDKGKAVWIAIHVETLH